MCGRCASDASARIRQQRTWIQRSSQEVLFPRDCFSRADCKLHFSKEQARKRFPSRQPLDVLRSFNSNFSAHHERSANELCSTHTAALTSEIICVVSSTWRFWLMPFASNSLQIHNRFQLSKLLSEHATRTGLFAFHQKSIPTYAGARTHARTHSGFSAFASCSNWSAEVRVELLQLFQVFFSDGESLCRR